mmetsp:Transcript_13690/g.39635  ORF Transcript_13690/g.39635 Transcript_13690/m.39635 type:complete len:492 (-) Transcript_13690:32-1507(-)
MCASPGRTHTSPTQQRLRMAAAAANHGYSWLWQPSCLAAARQHKAHRVLAVCKRPRRRLVRCVGAPCQYAVDVSRVGHQVGVFGLDRLQVRNERICQLGLEVAPPHRRDLGRNRLLCLPTRQLVQRQQVCALGALLVAKLEALKRVRFAALDLVLDVLGRIGQVDAREVVLRALGHLGGAVLQRHDTRARRRDEHLGHLEHAPAAPASLLPALAAVQTVDTLCNVARQLQVLLLVLAHGYQVGLVQEDVCGHEHWIGEQSSAHLLSLLPALLLELDHTVEPANGRHAVQQPLELRMSRHMRLDKHSCPIWVDARCQVGGCHGACGIPELLGIVRYCDGMQIHYTEEGVIRLLEPHPVFNSTHVVSKVQLPGWLYTRQHSLPLRHQAICGGLGVGRRCSSCRRLDHGAAAAGAARDDRRFALSCGDAERTRDAAMKHVGTAAGVAAAAVAARAAAAAASAGGGAAAAAAAACHSLTRRVRSRQMPQRVHGAG